MLASGGLLTFQLVNCATVMLFTVVIVSHVSDLLSYQSLLNVSDTNHWSALTFRQTSSSYNHSEYQLAPAVGQLH
jgi:hypothetical protein